MNYGVYSICAHRGKICSRASQIIVDFIFTFRYFLLLLFFCSFYFQGELEQQKNEGSFLFRIV